ncbi:MAG: hypothetical protein ACREPX_11200 [Rhodanobacteraceae bacterium]
MRESSPQTTSRAVLATIVVLACIATLRAFFVWSHEPLYAYANSYDQTRYTTCFHFYPDRPDSVAPQQNSPDAPYSHYRFIETADPMCYGSSEFVFGGATALIWKTGGWLTGDTIHDVRWVGALRWFALLALSLAFSRAWLRRGNSRAALANAALLPLVFADPGNVLYLNTFYAEWTALLAAYATLGLALLFRDTPRTRARILLLAFAALILATSKIQHMLLPLALAIVIALLDRVRLRHISWRALALAGGAAIGLCVQLVQLQRTGSMMDTIRQYNNADVVFTALLPLADDPRALLVEMHLDPSCASFTGQRAWQMPDLPDRACRGLAGFTRGMELGVLLRHPEIAARLARRGVVELDPWLAQNIGHVEGAQFAKIPASVPSIGAVLVASPVLHRTLLALPVLALLFLLIRPGMRAGSATLDMTALVVMLMIATLGVTLLGDGLADTAKQGHLITNAALAWLLVGIMMRVPVPRRIAPAERAV